MAAEVDHNPKHGEHGFRTYKCPDCDLIFAFKQGFRKHELLHKGTNIGTKNQNVCNVCQIGFKKPLHLSIHLRLHSGEPIFSCTYCGKFYKEEDFLKKHLQKCFLHQKSKTAPKIFPKVIKKKPDVI